MGMNQVDSAVGKHMNARTAPVDPGCYGVMCPQHKRCARYHAVEGSDALQTIATCAVGEIRQIGRPLFVEM